MTEKPIYCSACGTDAENIKQMRTISETGQPLIKSFAFCRSCSEKTVISTVPCEMEVLVNTPGFDSFNTGEQNIDNIDQFIDQDNLPMVVMIDPKFEFSLRGRLVFLSTMDLNVKMSKLVEAGIRYAIEHGLSDEESESPFVTIKYMSSNRKIYVDEQKVMLKPRK